MYQTVSPVLLIVFNRPESVRSIFRILKSVRPARLYIAADAPRPNRPSDVYNCRRTLEVFATINWPCECRFRINETNLGSHTSIPQAIDWFFEAEERGIVLEDDCVPSEDFFRFCDDLLARYQDHPRVMWINGSNLQFSDQHAESSFFFSVYPISWGWASWRRAWHTFDREAREVLALERMCDVIDASVGHSLMARLYWRAAIEYAYSIKNWDWRWMYTLWANNGLACTPASNLISNVGFGVEAVHGGHRHDPRGHLPTLGLSSAIRAPDRLESFRPLDVHMDGNLYCMRFFSILKMYLVSRFPSVRNLARKILGRRI